MITTVSSRSLSVLGFRLPVQVGTNFVVGPPFRRVRRRTPARGSTTRVTRRRVRPFSCPDTQEEEQRTPCFVSPGVGNPEVPFVPRSPCQQTYPLSFLKNLVIDETVTSNWGFVSDQGRVQSFSLVTHGFINLPSAIEWSGNGSVSSPDAGNTR